MEPTSKSSSVAVSSNDVMLAASIMLLLGLGPFLLMLDTLCLNSYDNDAVEVLFWVSWAAFIPAGLGGLYISRRLSGVKSAVAMSGVGIMLGVLLATMLLRRSYAFAHVMEKGAAEKIDVTLDEVVDLVADDGVALIALKAGQGFARPQPLTSVTHFSYGCHGQWSYHDCHMTPQASKQACQEWIFPDECPGAELLMLTPLWTDSSQTGQAKALAVQRRTFLFNNETGRANWEANHSSIEFTAELCRDGRFCAFLLSNPHVETHWNRWHSKDNAMHVLHEGIGEYARPMILHDESMDRAKGLATDELEQLGMAGDHLPLLWVPADTHESFQDWENRLQTSEAHGHAGFVLLIVFACFFAVCGISLLIWAIKPRKPSPEVAEPSV